MEMNSGQFAALGSLDQSAGTIVVRGARTHNLKSVDLDLPHGQLIVLTGPSGCGKSSLAFDTIFAEGQRQYVESLSLFSRQFFDQLPRPDVDQITGIPPTLSLDQARQRSTRRSTVGTMTEIYDYLRLLMARVGRIHCYQCGRPIEQQTPDEICDRVLQLPERTKVMVLAPMVTEKTGAHAEVLQRVRRERLVRVRIDGQLHDIDQAPVIEPARKHTIEAVTDRLIVREGIESRLLEAIDAAVRISSDGQVTICFQERTETSSSDWAERMYSTRYACPHCDLSYSEVQPRSFSFNSPFGACSDCSGLGTVVQFDPRSIIDRSLSIQQGAILAWEGLPKSQRTRWVKSLRPLVDKLGFELTMPLERLSDETWQRLLDNHDKQAPGVWALLQKEWVTTSDDDRMLELDRLRKVIPCSACDGSRVSEIARSVFFDGKHIGQWVATPLEELPDMLESGAGQLDAIHSEVASPLVGEINHRLRFLNRVGLGYLTLGRGSDTLSGGEFQRVRLASSIGSGVTSCCFVLDEPSIGLHARDTERLIETLNDLKQAGNSLLVVEHSRSIMLAADWIVDMGPGAGVDGGQVVASAAPDDLAHLPGSVTAPYLVGNRQVGDRSLSSKGDEADQWLQLRGAAGHNLQHIDVSIPLQRMTCVTGVSGSGKSTLVQHTLVPAVAEYLGFAAATPMPFDSLEGLDELSAMVVVDQKPIGRTPRACPATFCGLLDPIRKLFAATKQAKRLGFGIGRFSYNTQAGRCPDCKGLGYRRVKMNFMPDMFIQCDSCQGRRYNLQTLQIKFADQSIADILSLSVQQALELFDGFSKIRSTLQLLADVGLGYLKLGQPATTLSGGESQRLKLANELVKPGDQRAIYFLDEPTTGLHFSDVDRLLGLLRRLVDQGHTLVVVEHNLDVIHNADWMIELGPGAGQQGGQVVGAGRPELLAQSLDSPTAMALRG